MKIVTILQQEIKTRENYKFNQLKQNKIKIFISFIYLYFKKLSKKLHKNHDSIKKQIQESKRLQEKEETRKQAKNKNNTKKYKH